MDKLEVFYPFIAILAVVIVGSVIRNFWISVRENVASSEGELVPDPKREYVYGQCPACGSKLFKDHVRYEQPANIFDGKKEKLHHQFLFTCPCQRSTMVYVPSENCSELRDMLDFRKREAMVMSRAGSVLNHQK